MRTKYLDNGFFMVSAKDAKALCVENTLPATGNERRGKLGCYRVWVTRTMVDSKQVWAFYFAENYKYAVCQGCTGVMTDIDLNYGVCLDCTKARHKAVFNKKCVCRKSDKRPSDIKKTCSRTWIACERCLGSIKQLS